MRYFTFCLTFCLVSSALFAADNPFVGTWKLNTAKSKLAPGRGVRSETVKYETDGEKMRRIVSGEDSEGKPLTQGRAGGASSAWAGEEHEASTSPGVVTTVSVKKLSDHVVEMTVKGDGKVLDRIHSAVSSDGKTMTNTEDGVNEKGQKFHSVEVLEKQ